MLQYSGSRKPSPIPFRPVYFPSAPKHHKQQHTIDQFGPLQTKSQRLPSIEGVCPFFHENTSLSCDDKTNGTKESIRKFLGKLSGFTFLKKKICDWSSTKRTEASTRPLNNPPNAKVLKIDTPNLEVKPRKVEPKPPQSQTVYSITEEKNIVKRAVQYLDSQAQLHFVQKLLDIALVAQPNYQYFITPDPSAPTRSAVRVGQRYDFHHILGAGSFSEVRLAKDLNNDERLVAIKLVKASKLRQNCRLMETMAREVAILAKVRHTNIVKYEDIFVVRDYICIVMEYVDGGELFNVILNLGGGGMKEVAAKVVLKQILSAVTYLHETNIVHRDLKLENVLVEGTTMKTVKLIDFGLARAVSPDGHPLSTRCGSEEYAAPEIIKGQLYDGKMADAWSFGVIMYACLLGCLPFNPDVITGAGLGTKIISGKYIMDERFISTDAASIIKRLLVVDPAQRLSLAKLQNDPYFIT